MPAGVVAAPGLIETFVYPASFGHPAHTETFVIPGGFGVPAGYGGGYSLPYGYSF